MKYTYKCTQAHGCVRGVACRIGVHTCTAYQMPGSDPALAYMQPGRRGPAMRAVAPGWRSHSASRRRGRGRGWTPAAPCAHPESSHCAHTRVAASKSVLQGHARACLVCSQHSHRASTWKQHSSHAEAPDTGSRVAITSLSPPFSYATMQTYSWAQLLPVQARMRSAHGCRGLKVCHCNLEPLIIKLAAVFNVRRHDRAGRPPQPRSACACHQHFW